MNKQNRHLLRTQPMLQGVLSSPTPMTGLYLEGKLLEDVSIAESEKFWLESFPWSPFLVQIEIIQLTGHSRFGAEMEK